MATTSPWARSGTKGAGRALLGGAHHGANIHSAAVSGHLSPGPGAHRPNWASAVPGVTPGSIGSADGDGSASRVPRRYTFGDGTGFRESSLQRPNAANGKPGPGHYNADIGSVKRRTALDRAPPAARVNAVPRTVEDPRAAADARRALAPPVEVHVDLSGSSRAGRATRGSVTGPTGPPPFTGSPAPRRPAGPAPGLGASEDLHEQRMPGFGSSAVQRPLLLRGGPDYSPAPGAYERP